MLVVDTDLYSITARSKSEVAERFHRRVDADGRRKAITVVTVQEQLRGRLAACQAAKDSAAYGLAAQRLREAVEDFRGAKILDFDAAAAAEFDRLKAAKIRVGTNDLRIAAIVLAHDALLLTRNLADFSRVLGLPADDWSV